MKEIIKKLTSRKFLTAVAGLIAGIAILNGADEATVKVVSGAAISIISVVAYIVTEGRIDATCLTQIGADAGVIVAALDAVEDKECEDDV